MGLKVIKFSSSWCGPCKVMSPIYDKISKMEKYKNVNFLSYDIEEDEDGIELVEQFKIKNVPTIVFADENNNVIRKIIGLVQEDNLIEMLNEVIEHGL